MADSTLAPIGAIVVDGIVQSLVYPHPDDAPLDECFPAGVVTPIPAGTVVTPGMTWNGTTFGPAPAASAPSPMPRLATTYQLLGAFSDAQRAAYPGPVKGWDQRMFSARDTPWPEDNEKIGRIATALGTTPAAWFDAALGAVTGVSAT